MPWIGYLLEETRGAGVRRDLASMGGEVGEEMPARFVRKDKSVNAAPPEVRETAGQEELGGDSSKGVIVPVYLG